MKLTEISRQDENAMWQRAKVIGLPDYLVVPALNDFLKWGRSSGWEFAISRFKAMKTNLLRVVTGLDPIWEAGQYPSKGIGWYKGLVTLARKDDTLLSKVLSLLNVYTIVVLSERTSRQMDKFVSGLNAQPARISNRFLGKLLNAANQVPVPGAVEEPSWFLDSVWSSSRRTPSVGVSDDGKLDMFVTKPEIGGVADSTMVLLAGTNGGEILSLLDRYPFMREVFNNLHEYDNASLVEKFGSQTHQKVGLLGGTIGFIQEAGGKLRSVANPYRWWQASLDPLARSIHTVLRKLPWDCTHNQLKALPAVQTSLQRGDEWFSVDISSATDHFPLEYQVEVLKYVYQHDPLATTMIFAFMELSRLPWWYRDMHGEVQTISWRKGQPMGLRPSFGSFALTHGLVLLALNDGKHNEDFFVLGDDVIIRGEELHRRYRHFLQWHEIPVSEAKTLRGLYAEFASKIITPSKVIPIYKWRSHTPSNFVDLARLWGPNSYPLFSKRARKVLDKLSKIPEIYGGLGWGDPDTLDYSIPSWVLKRIGRDVDVSLVRNYLNQVYRSEVVSKTGVVPILHPKDVSDRSGVVTDFINRITGLAISDDALVRSLASNAVELLDITLPAGDLDGKPSSSLSLWESRLGID